MPTSSPWWRCWQPSDTVIAVAGQDEDGTLAMVTTLPIRRRRITAEKSLAMATQAVIIVSVSTAFIAIGYAFDITVGAAACSGHPSACYSSASTSD